MGINRNVAALIIREHAWGLNFIGFIDLNSTRISVEHSLSEC